MRPCTAAWAVICTLFLLAAVSLVAQQTSSTPVTITVSDAKAGRIPNAQIKLDPAPDPAPAKMETDARGELSLDLKPGGYVLAVHFQGFQTLKRHIEIPASNQVQTIPVTMEVGSFINFIQVSSADTLRIVAHPNHDDVIISSTEFKTLPHTFVTVHNPHANADETYSGVPLSDLLAKVGAPLGKELRGTSLTSYVVATGADGYQVVLSLPEIDPDFHPGVVLVADSMNSHPLDANSGPFKLVVTEDKRPARWVRNLTSIELRFLY
jgi:hypothetical protein